MMTGMADRTRFDELEDLISELAGTAKVTAETQATTARVQTEMLQMLRLQDSNHQLLLGIALELTRAVQELGRAADSPARERVDEAVREIQTQRRLWENRNRLIDI